MNQQIFEYKFINHFTAEHFCYFYFKYKRMLIPNPFCLCYKPALSCLICKKHIIINIIFYLNNYEWSIFIGSKSFFSSKSSKQSNSASSKQGVNCFYRMRCTNA